MRTENAESARLVTESRRPYQRPIIGQVDLVAGQVLDVFCKESAGGASYNNATCGTTTCFMGTTPEERYGS